jgi:hypothetical protein
MCFKQRSAANRSPPARRVDFFLANTRDKINKPYKKPLYWKWIWSMIKSPGERRIERAAAWEGRLKAGGAD